MLVTSNFSFSHHVFNRLLIKDRLKSGLYDKGLEVEGFMKCEFLFYLNRHDYIATAICFV